LYLNANIVLGETITCCLPRNVFIELDTDCTCLYILAQELKFEKPDARRSSDVEA